MNPIVNAESNMVGPTVRALRQLSPGSQGAVAALASLFRFLHSEGLWPANPLNGVGHVRVRYRERLCPDLEDVTKVLGMECFRRKDTEKLRMLVLLLATTGLRISEAAGILKRDIDLGPTGARRPPQFRTAAPNTSSQ